MTGQLPLRGLALALGLALSASACSSDEHVIFFNGFDFPVTATVTSEGGDTTTVEIGPRSRVGADVAGKSTVRVTTASGELIRESKASFPEEDKRRETCPFVYNVQGGAAVAVVDVVYGQQFGTPNKNVLSGEISDRPCNVNWRFEDPPEAVSTEKYTPGMTLGVMRYEGEGDWLAAAKVLLELQDRWPDQRRGAAYRIVGTVVKHDPNNPKLEEAKKLFAAHKVRMPTVEALEKAAERERKRKERRKAREAKRAAGG